MKKQKKWYGILAISFILILFIGVFIYYYSPNNETMTIAERTWIQNNKEKIIDIDIFNDVPIFGFDGEGVVFDFIADLKNDLELDFNEVSYLHNNYEKNNRLVFKVIASDTNLSKNDLLFYEDKYVLIGKENKKYDDLNSIPVSNIGVLGQDIEPVSYYLSDCNNCSYTPYETVAEVISSYDNNLTSMMVLPYNLYLNTIISSNNKYVEYNISEINIKYVLTIPNNSGKLKSIIQKYYNGWLDKNLGKKYNDNFNNLYFKLKNINDEMKMDVVSKRYIFGYVEDTPLIIKYKDKIGGIVSNYINNFSKLTNTEINYKQYKNYEDLIKDFNSGKIDIVFNNFNDSKLTSDRINTISPYLEEYVVLTKVSNNITINSVKSLKNQEILIKNNTKIHQNLKNYANFKTYKSNELLFNKIKDDSIIIIDADTYNYYQFNKLKNMVVKYRGNLTSDYYFAIKQTSTNEIFKNIFNQYISTLNYNSIRYNYNLENDVNGIEIFINNIKIIFASLFAIFIGIIILRIIIRNRKIIKEKQKEEKIRFIDPLTSLKNRMYLSQNIDKWDENKVYPQAIIVIDLNNVKYVNDNYGHEEGDNLIKAAASILIANQYPNSDIIRTDGNEFLVYLIDYDEAKIVAYTRKIFKLLKELPHGFGASLGYSMIEDEIKTIEDAINEATLEMRTNKEHN